jgi:hypothetical protein
MTVHPENFDTSPDVMGQLKAAAVDDSVILAMVRQSRRQYTV